MTVKEHLRTVLTMLAHEEFWAVEAKLTVEEQRAWHSYYRSVTDEEIELIIDEHMARQRGCATCFNSDYNCNLDPKTCNRWSRKVE